MRPSAERTQRDGSTAPLRLHNGRRLKLYVCATLISVALHWQLISAGTPQALPEAHDIIGPSLGVRGPFDGVLPEINGAIADAAVRIPHNITGTFRGDWSAASLPRRVIDIASVFQRSQGIIIMQLNSTRSDHDDVHHVEGEITFREGPYMGQSELMMRLTGFYIPASGRLHAVAEPESPLLLPFASSEAHPGSTYYRKALHDAVKHWTHTGNDFVTIPPQDPPPAGADEGKGPKDHKGGLKSLSRPCSFVMDLAVSVAAAGSTDISKAADHGGVSATGSNSEVAPAGTVTQRTEASAPRVESTLLPLEGNDVETQDLVLNGTLASAGCGVSLRVNVATTRIERYYAKAIHYSLMVAFVAFIQIALLVRQMEASAQTPAASQLSQITIGHQALMDAYLCLLHLTTGIIVDPLFTSFATAAFLEFMLFGIFEMRWLLVAWRAQQGALLDTWQAQRQLTAVYSRFYVLLLFAILMSWHLIQHVQWVVFPLCAWWVPQILFSTWRDTRQPLTPRYVLGTSVSRLAIPLYLLACPHNLLRVPPAYGLAVALAVFVMAQAALLVAQHRKGPRCWVPKRFLPLRYDYYRTVSPAILPGSETNKITSDASRLADSSTPNKKYDSGPMDEETGHAVECSICMTSIDVGTRSRRMVTPCAHFFHPLCLTKWMDVKMICPVCRRSLPPP